MKLNPIDYDVLTILAEDTQRRYFSTRQEAGVDLREMLNRRYKESQIAYSIQKLRKYNLIENVRRGVYKVTAKGRYTLTERRNERDAKYDPRKLRKVIREEYKKLSDEEPALGGVIEIPELRNRVIKRTKVSREEFDKELKTMGSEHIIDLKFAMDTLILKDQGKNPDEGIIHDKGLIYYVLWRPTAKQFVREEIKQETPKSGVPITLEGFRPVREMEKEELRSEFINVKKALSDRTHGSREIRSMYRSRLYEIETELDRRKKEEKT